jgi:glycosyltransferase involved in cell wall biosynthesis
MRRVGATGPLVTVILPCFNAGGTLSRTLSSVGHQTYENLEIIIVDDGSTDASSEIAEKYIRRDSRATVVQQNNSGVAVARNRAIERASGEYLAPIDADDLWNARKIEQTVQRISQNSDCGLVYNWFENINSVDEIFFGGFRNSFTGRVLPELCRRDFIGNASSVLMQTRVVRSVGGYDASLRARGAEGGEDWQLALKIAESYLLDVVPEPLTGYRHSNTSMSSDVRRMMRSAELVVEEFSQRYPTLISELENHLVDRNRAYFFRCLRERRWSDAAWFLRRSVAENRRSNADTRLKSTLLGFSKQLSERSWNYLSAPGGIAVPRRRRKFE